MQLQNFTMEYLVTKGAPRNKLLLGIPFYGQSFTLSKSGNHKIKAPSAGPGDAGEHTEQPGMLAYYEICNKIRNQRWIVNRDNTGKSGPYAYYGDQWVGFEDIKSIHDKANYIKTKGFGGAVAWTIDLDDFSNQCCGGSFPLLRSLNRGLGLIPDIASREDCTKPPEPVTPTPPQTTTGVDTGAEHTTEHPHSEWTWKPTPTKPTKPTTSSWWSTTESTSTSPWWTTKSTTKRSSTSSSTTSTTTPRTTTSTTTRKPTVPSWSESTTIPPSGIIRPEVDKPSKPCEAGAYYPDKENCNAFYRCILGERKKQFCAGGLHWNQVGKFCDWPKEAKCKEQPRKFTKIYLNAYKLIFTLAQDKPTSLSWQQSTQFSSSSHRQTTSSTTSYWETTSPSTNHWQTTSSSTSYWQPTSPTTTLAAIIAEKCSTGQYYPHKDCTSFYVCVNGHLVAQNCAPGLFYNVGENMCDWRFKVSCVGRREMGKKIPNIEKITNGIFTLSKNKILSFLRFWLY